MTLGDRLMLSMIFGIEVGQLFRDIIAIIERYT